MIRITDLDEDAILAIHEVPEDWCLSFKSISSRGVPATEVRRTVRKLARMGVTVFASGLWSDDGEPMGSGYGLTKYGRALASAIEARRAATLGAAHKSAGPQDDAQTASEPL